MQKGYESSLLESIPKYEEKKRSTEECYSALEELRARYNKLVTVINSVHSAFPVLTKDESEKMAEEERELMKKFSVIREQLLAEDDVLDEFARGEDGSLILTNESLQKRNREKNAYVKFYESMKKRALLNWKVFVDKMKSAKKTIQKFVSNVALPKAKRIIKGLDTRRERKQTSRTETQGSKEPLVYGGSETELGAQGVRSVAFIPLFENSQKLHVRRVAKKKKKKISSPRSMQNSLESFL